MKTAGIRIAKDKDKLIHRIQQKVQEIQHKTVDNHFYLPLLKKLSEQAEQNLSPSTWCVYQRMRIDTDLC